MRLLINKGLIFLIFILICQNIFTADKKIDSDILIKMDEVVDSVDSKLYLHCETEREYKNYNYQIGKSIDKQPGRINIEFNSIIIPDIVSPALGPARTKIDLGNLEEGTYELEIKVEGEKSYGYLTVNPEYYRIDFEKQNRIQIIDTLLNRIPKNTIWGTIGYDERSSKLLAKDFIDSLKNLGAYQYTYRPGKYKYFEIDHTGEIMPPEDYRTNFIQKFIFKYPEDNTKLEELVGKFGNKHRDSLSIVLYTLDGKRFRSW